MALLSINVNLSSLFLVPITILNAKIKSAFNSFMNIEMTTDNLLRALYL